MSVEFIQMISDWNDRRYSERRKFLAINKVPCGLFIYPSVPNNVMAGIDWLKNRCKLNLTCICVMKKEDKNILPVEDETVVTLEEFQDLTIKPRFMFICTRDIMSGMFMDYFERFGIQMFAHDGLTKSEDRYKFYIKHLPELYVIHQMLADEESKKTFRAYLTAGVTNLLNDFRFSPGAEYFLEGFLPKEGDIIIDGGAYDGDTAVDFAKQGAKVYAFEMNTSNYKRGQTRIASFGEEYDIILENLGLSDREDEMSYTPGYLSSHRDPNGTLTGKFIDLDTYIARNNLPRIDYIKLDIEGSELDMLHGAAKTITLYKPKLVICAYHKWEDLWTLATYIKSLRSDYEFKFRHYQIDYRNAPLNPTQRATFKNFRLDYFCPTHYDAILYCK